MGRKMTLREAKTIEELPKNKYKLATSMMKAGYTKNTAYCSPIRKRIMASIKKLDFFDEEKIKRDIAMTFRMAKKNKDITNMARINEHRAKIKGMVIDKSEVENKNPEKIVIAYGNKQIPTEETTPNHNI